MSKLRYVCAAVFLFPVIAHADNVLHLGIPVLDRPTLMSLGVQLPITGDDNYNATVTLRYRKSGTTAWRTGLPLYRAHPESIIGYPAIPQFAGSIVDLRPNTSYDIELHAYDPDGPVDQTLTLTGTTRAIPGDPASPRAVSVSNPASLTNALAGAQPGDVITLANGVYSGLFGINVSGTAANPIVIRGASQDGVILDGGNCTGCNIIEVYASFVHIEQLTLRNAERAIRFQVAGTQANVVRRVHITDVTMGITGRPPQYDYYIADNIVEGRLSWPSIYTDDGGAHSDDTGIAAQGSGMVVAHNRISGFGDAMRIESQGARGCDFYNNDVLWSYDNGIELDEAEGNVRAIRNRFTNVFMPLSVQPIYIGPAYLLRNIELNSVDEQIKFHAEGSNQLNGVLAYHNTFLSSLNDLQTDTPNAAHHFALENNLLIGPSPVGQYAVYFDTPIDDGLFDYNGYYPDGPMAFNSWTLGNHTYSSLAAAQAAGFEQHGRILTGQIFANGLTAPTDYHTLLQPSDVTPASSGPAIDHAVLLPGINDSFMGAGPDLGAVESGCPAVIYGPRPAGTDESNESIGCEADGTQPPPVSATAQFVRADTSTQGAWRASYGAEGYLLAADGVQQPSYGQAAISGQSQWVWAASTTDVRALQSASGGGQIAATWYSAASFTIDVNLASGAAHQIALYTVDYDSLGRSERVDVIDAGTGTILDSRSLSAFSGGQYLVWNISGHVQIRVSNLNQLNGVISGVFFGGAPAGAAQFVNIDTATQGSWRNAYGSEGYLLADGTQQPAYGQAAISGQSQWTWAAFTSDVRALQTSANPGTRIAATWYSAGTFTIDVNLSPGAAHQIALYTVDYDSLGRSERFDVVDPVSGTVLDSRSVSGFSGGQYLVWTVSGHVQIRVTNLNQLNGVVSGVFFGGALSPATAAQFVNMDTSTQGSWRNVYGSEGYMLAADGTQQPTYGQAAISGQNQWTWAAFTSDVRALQTSANPGTRIAATWYSAGTFTIDVNLSPGAAHQVALYTVDYDSLNRMERFDVVDPVSGTVLDSRSVSGFSGGQYLVWSISGHVQIRVTNLNQVNAVVSGIFFH